MEGQVEGARPPGRCGVQPGGAGLPFLYGCGKEGTGGGRRGRGERGVGDGGAGVDGGVGSGGRGAWRWGDLRCSCPHPTTWRPQGRRRWGSFPASFPLSYSLDFLSFAFPLWSPWCDAALRLGTGLGGGQRGACNEPPLRGQRTGNGLYILAIISIGRMRAMNKQKKKNLYRGCGEITRRAWCASEFDRQAGGEKSM